MASPDIVLTKLTQLALLYPQAGVSSTQIVSMAEPWVDACVDLTDQEFADAVREHTKTSRFWPTPAEILERHQEIVAATPAQQSERRALPVGVDSMCEANIAAKDRAAEKFAGLRQRILSRDDESWIEGPRPSDKENERVRRQSLERAGIESER